jgi:hypothetical protein
MHFREGATMYCNARPTLRNKKENGKGKQKPNKTETPSGTLAAAQTNAHNATEPRKRQMNIKA